MAPDGRPSPGQESPHRRADRVDRRPRHTSASRIAKDAARHRARRGAEGAPEQPQQRRTERQREPVEGESRDRDQRDLHRARRAVEGEPGEARPARRVARPSGAVRGQPADRARLRERCGCRARPGSVKGALRSWSGMARGPRRRLPPAEAGAASGSCGHPAVQPDLGGALPRRATTRRAVRLGPRPPSASDRDAGPRWPGCGAGSRPRSPRTGRDPRLDPRGIVAQRGMRPVVDGKKAAPSSKMRAPVLVAMNRGHGRPSAGALLHQKEAIVERVLAPRRQRLGRTPEGPRYCR